MGLKMINEKQIQEKETYLNKQILYLSEEREHIITNIQKYRAYKKSFNKTIINRVIRSSLTTILSLAIILGTVAAENFAYKGFLRSCYDNQYLMLEENATYQDTSKQLLFDLTISQTDLEEKVYNELIQIIQKFYDSENIDNSLDWTIFLLLGILFLLSGGIGLYYTNIIGKCNLAVIDSKKMLEIKQNLKELLNKYIEVNKDITKIENELRILYEKYSFLLEDIKVEESQEKLVRGAI